MTISKWVLVSIPSAIAQIKTPHESDVSINQAKLFMMSPVEYDVLIHSINCFESICWQR